MKCYFEITFSIWGLPGVILEGHFGILEAPERFKNHIRGSKFILRRRVCERRVALAALSGREWPQVPAKHPQGCPKGAPRAPKWSPKGTQNGAKTVRKRHLREKT